MRHALFAVLMPSKELRKHRDPFAFTLRYSLALSTPNAANCGLIIDGQHYHWRDGEGVFFDETYMRSAYNYSDKVRLILMIDVDRSLRIKWIEKACYYFGCFFNRLFAVDNVDGSYSVFGNTIGKKMLACGRLLKSFKHKNCPLYIASKIVVVGALLFFLAWLLI